MSQTFFPVAVPGHESFPGYSPTPVAGTDHLAGHTHTAVLDVPSPHSWLCALTLADSRTHRLPRSLHLLTISVFIVITPLSYTCTYSLCCTTDEQSLQTKVCFCLLHSHHHTHYTKQKTCMQERVRKEFIKRKAQVIVKQAYWPVNYLHVTRTFYVLILFFFFFIYLNPSFF